MLILLVTASMLYEGALIDFGGQLHYVEFPHTSVSGVTTLELLPLVGRRRPVHVQMHRDAYMAVHIPLM